MTAFKNDDAIDRPAIVNVVSVVAIIDVSVFRYLKLIEILSWKYAKLENIVRKDRS